MGRADDRAAVGLRRSVRAEEYIMRNWLVATVLLVGTGAAALADGEPSFRAFWADAFATGFKSSSQISSLVSRAAAGNYNAIIVEVLAYHDTGSGGHGAYWNSSIVPKASDISGSIDPLALLVSTAHAQGIEVHAWIVPYRVCTSWPPSGNSEIAAHPEWFMTPRDYMDSGPVQIGGKYVLDPGSRDAQDYIVRIVRELVTNYEIDGINLDYIRYTQEDAGYPADESYEYSSLARWHLRTGYSVIPQATGNTSWDAFRRETIGELVRRLRAEIASITSNPRQPVALTADLLCSGDAPSNFVYSDAYRYRFQDWERWLEEGWLDAGVPMNYKREYVDPQDDWFRNWVDAAIDWSYDRHVYCGQANYLNTMADSITQMEYVLNAGADGVSNYSYYATVDSNMDGNYENDWGWYTYVGAQLYTDVVETPVMPWRDPNLATEGTVWGQVYNEAEDAPVDYATVHVIGADSFVTDGNGMYVATLLPAASGGTVYDLLAVADGCDTETEYDVVVSPAGLTRVDFLVCRLAAGPGDMNGDGHYTWDDMPQFWFCFAGPDTTYSSGHTCLNGDVDADEDIDLLDFANLQEKYEGE